MDSKTAAILQDIIRRESRSLVQYVRDAFPWTTPEEQQALAQFQAMVEEEQKCLADLSQFLTRRKQQLPYLGLYPNWFTTINYVSLEHLLPLLVNHARQNLTQLERDLAGLTDADAIEKVRQFVDVKRRHLQALEALAAAHPPTASTVR
jgi:hypothetical protein